MSEINVMFSDEEMLHLTEAATAKGLSVEQFVHARVTEVIRQNESNTAELTEAEIALAESIRRKG